MKNFSYLHISTSTNCVKKKHVRFFWCSSSNTFYLIRIYIPLPETHWPLFISSFCSLVSASLFILSFFRIFFCMFMYQFIPFPSIYLCFVDDVNNLMTWHDNAQFELRNGAIRWWHWRTLRWLRCSWIHQNQRLCLLVLFRLQCGWRHETRPHMKLVAFSFLYDSNTSFQTLGDPRFLQSVTALIIFNNRESFPQTSYSSSFAVVVFRPYLPLQQFWEPTSRIIIFKTLVL